MFESKKISLRSNSVHRMFRTQSFTQMCISRNDFFSPQPKPGSPNETEITTKKEIFRNDTCCRDNKYRGKLHNESVKHYCTKTFSLSETCTCKTHTSKNRAVMCLHYIYIIKSFHVQESVITLMQSELKMRLELTRRSVSCIFILVKSIR